MSSGQPPPARLFAALLATLLGTALAGAARADLLVSSGGLASVARFDAATGAPLGLFVTQGEGGLVTPDGLAWGPDGNLYVSKERDSAVLRYDGKTGAFVDVFVAPSSGGLDGPYSLVFGPDGNLYVNSVSNNRVLRFNARTGAPIDVFASGNGLSFPTYLLFTPSAAGCQDDATHVCLQQGRFRVAADWQTAQGSGAGQAVRVTADTAYLWFFSAANVEVLVKVLDGCALAPGHFWVFAGGLTAVAVRASGCARRRRGRSSPCSSAAAPPTPPSGKPARASRRATSSGRTARPASAPSPRRSGWEACSGR